LPVEIPRAAVRSARHLIRQGDDPLGAIFSSLRAPAMRRMQGATYTPPAIVASMIGWAAGVAEPARVVDPGVGSARFLVAAGRRFPEARLIGIDIDPLAALLARAPGGGRPGRPRGRDGRRLPRSGRVPVHPQPYAVRRQPALRAAPSDQVQGRTYAGGSRSSSPARSSDCSSRRLRPWWSCRARTSPHSASAP
jgi:hypothetical protein